MTRSVLMIFMALVLSVNFLCAEEQTIPTRLNLKPIIVKAKRVLTRDDRLKRKALRYLMAKRKKHVVTRFLSRDERLRQSALRYRGKTRQRETARPQAV